ncbi:uncharacterized protein LOC134531695 [Bacillus rossius redtenbacheri]|uniref:uncharacterized protein LOC134531695 n=1 Tax=Bacillus rossius redtenbacheri TaxID=93214 RepID=UPI002FDDA22F
MENFHETKGVFNGQLMSPDRRVLGNIQNKFASDAMSPTTNLKLLTEVASDLEKQRYETDPSKGKSHAKCKTSSKFNTERKLKSLTLLCEKFLQIFPLNVSPNENIVISLDNVAGMLGTERRRLYDIINMLECLQMAQKVAKNRYRWFGCQKLHVTLAHLKCLAMKLGLQQQVHDMQTANNLEALDRCSEHEPLSSVEPAATPQGKADAPIVQFIITDEDADGDGSITTLNLDIVKKRFEPVVAPSGRADTSVADETPDLAPSEFMKMLPKIKSLGMLCQSFLMIFLVANKSYPITLDNISRILHLPVSCEGEADSGSCMADACPRERAISFKTKLRRLYDIANVMSSLHIICKIKRYELLTKKPLFKYIGPVVDVGDILQSEELNFSNLPRHSLLGSEALDRESETVLELRLQAGGHPQWVVSARSVGRSTQKRKLLFRNSETTPKLLRTKSSDVLCRKKKAIDSRHEKTKSSLDGILNIAEMELRRLQSLEGECLSGAPEKMRDAREEQPTAARRRLFARHHSDPCINTGHSAGGSVLLESRDSPNDQQVASSTSSSDQIGHDARQEDGAAAPATCDDTDPVVMIKCAGFGGQQLEQRTDETAKQPAPFPARSGQKLNIVRRLGKLSGDSLPRRPIVVKTYTCRRVKVLSACSPEMLLAKPAEPGPVNETSSSSTVLETIPQEGFAKPGSTVANLNRMVMFKDVEYSKLPKLKLVKIGNITKLVPLCNSNGKHQ